MTTTDVHTIPEFDAITWSAVPDVDGFDNIPSGSHAPELNTSLDSVLHSWALVQLYGFSYNQRTDGNYQPLLTETLPVKLAALLLILGRQQGGLIQYPGHQTLADWLGAEIETLDALLRAFHRQSLIRIVHRHIEILDADGLAVLAW